MSDGLVVVGGAGGLEVEYGDLGGAARLLQSAALQVVDTAMAARGVLTDGDLMASAVLDPGGFARVESAVLAAVAGPHGLLAAAARLESRSLRLREAVARYEAADRLGAGLHRTKQWAEGIAVAGALPLVPFLATTPFGFEGLQWVREGNADAFLAEHPGVAEDIAGGSPAFLDTLVTVGLGPFASLASGAATAATGHPGLPTSIEDAAGLVGALYPCGTPLVAGRGTDPGAPAAPHGVGDLLAALDHRDDLATGAAQGEIDVRRLTRTLADGTTVTSWVVDLPGTKQWQFDPRRREGLNDLATNLTTMAGDPSPRIDGVTRALELAGVGRDEPVMLVGHSQGGLVAMRAAQEYARDGRFAVTHVVTAGSPVARIDVPPSVSVLSLENRYDLVPRLDGDPAPDQANRVTVLFDAQSHEVGLNHATSTTYLPAARDVDRAMNDPSLAAWRDGAAAFLDADTARTTVWDIRNGG